MANHKSAEKRARQSIKRNKRNTNVENVVKTFEKKLLAAVGKKDVKEVTTALSDYMAKAMSAVTKGVLKKETVSRKIGRLSKKAQSVLGSTKK